MVLLKIAGILILLFGYFMVRHFPDEVYQNIAMTKAGILLGAVLLLVGIGLIIFG